MFDPAVDDMGFAHPRLERVEAAVYLGQHAVADGFVFDHLPDFFLGERGLQVTFLVFDALDIGHEDQLFGFQGRSHGGGHKIRIDIQRFPFLAAPDGSDDRNEFRLVENLQHPHIDVLDFPDQPQVDDLRPVGLRRLPDLAVPFRVDEVAVLAGDAHCVAAVPVDEGDDVLVDFPSQYHFDDVDHLLAGHPLPVDEFRLDAEQLQRPSDLRSAAVHDHRIDADVLHHHHVESERLLQRLVEEELGGARKQMTLDALTQLYNRGALDFQLERTASMSFFSGTSACLLIVDVDHFKHVNDTYGHPAGDVVLQQVAKRLVSTFPRKTDFIARYGGEEFCVLLQGADGELSQRLGERLLDALRGEGFSYQDVTIPVTASIGVAQLLPGETALSWLERADRALYRAKDNGRNQLCLATEHDGAGKKG